MVLPMEIWYQPLVYRGSVHTVILNYRSPQNKASLAGNEIKIGAKSLNCHRV